MPWAPECVLSFQPGLLGCWGHLICFQFKACDRLRLLTGTSLPDTLCPLGAETPWTSWAALPLPADPNSSLNLHARAVLNQWRQHIALRFRDQAVSLKLMPGTFPPHTLLALLADSGPGLTGALWPQEVAAHPGVPRIVGRRGAMHVAHLQDLGAHPRRQPMQHLGKARAAGQVESRLLFLVHRLHVALVLQEHLADRAAGPRPQLRPFLRCN